MKLYRISRKDAESGTQEYLMDHEDRWTGCEEEASLFHLNGEELESLEKEGLTAVDTGLTAATTIKRITTMYKREWDACLGMSENMDHRLEEETLIDAGEPDLSREFWSRLCARPTVVRVESGLFSRCDFTCQHRVFGRDGDAVAEEEWEDTLNLAVPRRISAVYRPGELLVKIGEHETIEMHLCMSGDDGSLPDMAGMDDESFRSFEEQVVAIAYAHLPEVFESRREYALTGAELVRFRQAVQLALGMARAKEA